MTAEKNVLLSQFLGIYFQYLGTFYKISPNKSIVSKIYILTRQSCQNLPDNSSVIIQSNELNKYNIFKLKTSLRKTPYYFYEAHDLTCVTIKSALLPRG